MNQKGFPLTHSYSLLARLGILAAAASLSACSPPAGPASQAGDPPAAETEAVDPAAAADAAMPEEPPAPPGDPAATETTAAADRLVVDPACLVDVAWFSEREAVDIPLTGCRDASELPAVDEDGWRTFTGDDGATIRTRGETRDPQTGSISFEVIYNAGGTLSGKYRVTGVPDATGVLKTGNFGIEALS